tara:strand:+ start:33 stop:830 length:798 start_codon:yes stop_codon:yes gene_type:complete
MADIFDLGFYSTLKESGSLKAFYDDIVYWELAKNNNKFFVTFMDGLYGLPNRQQESIGTAEISYPHTSAGNASTGSYTTGINRINAAFDAFMWNDETGSGTDDFPTSQHYNGFIPITELRGTRFFETTITASRFVDREYNYEIYDPSTDTIIVSRSVHASYFYPFSSHQLSVLRAEPTIIINLAKESELYNGIGERGFAVVPQETHPKLRNNLEYYLEKAGLIEKTTKTKVQQNPEKGGVNKGAPEITQQGTDIYGKFTGDKFTT